jgi:hypothetical protein
MAQITDTVLKTALASMLKVGIDAMHAYWDGIIRDSNNAAWGEIQRRLTARGFTANQIASWEDSAEFNRDIGLFWCLVKGAGLHGYDDKFIKLLDRRAELLEVQLASLPADDADTVGFGKMSNADDVFLDNQTGKFRKW